MLEQDRASRLALPRSRPADGALEVSADLLLDVAGALAAADTLLDVADAPLRLLSRLPGVRAGLVVRAPRPGGDPVVLASTGYDCTTMGAGAVLPHGAGLPVTEAVRTGQPQVVGTGPSWVAVPCGPGAALLLSLTVPPPDDDGVGRLVRLGDLLRGALQRAGRASAARADLAVLEEGLAAGPDPTPDLVLRSRPYRPPLSGDVVEDLRDGDVRWVLVADVCGRGARASVDADRLRSAFVACAPGAAGPADVLARLDAVLRGGEEDFATALVLQADGLRVRLASAGHPAPLTSAGVAVPLVPGRPLGLHLPEGWTAPTTSDVDLGPGTLLLLVTDGLVDRGHEVDLAAVVRALPAGLTAAALADAVLAACSAAGPAQDDATLAVLQL